MNNINQKALIKKYTEENIVPFNEELFVRSEDKIIEELKKVILSCQREVGFVLKVINFTVIEDYGAVMDTLFMYEEMREYKNSSKKDKQIKLKPKKDNPYSYINLKDTDMKLLIVKYYIEVNGKAEYIDVIIAVPRVVNKYYFKISGNYYLSQYQIIDTTYNNASSSKAKLNKVTIRNMFMPIRIFKKKYQIVTIDKQEKDCISFASKVFSKTFALCKFLLGKWGLNKTLIEMGLDRFILVTEKPMDTNEFYVFVKNHIYINVYKEAFDRDETVQSITYTLYTNIAKNTNYTDVFSIDYWLRSLGREFNIDNEEKGMQILVSLEGIYDIKTKEILRVPDYDKQDIYHLLIWSIREFGQLMLKDNFNLAAKRLRCEEYIASIYAAKLSTGLYRISNSSQKRKKRMTVSKIKKVVNTLPMYLISAITKCNLINYRDLVHDLDSIVVLSCTFKEASTGIKSNMGNETMKTVPDDMRYTHISHLDRIDLDSSKKSDPGMGFSLLPTVKLYDGYFSDYREPDTWKDNFSEIMNNYKKTTGIKEALVFEDKILGRDRKEEIKEVDESLNVMKSLMRPIYFIESSSSIVDIAYAMEYSGTITVENGDDDDEYSEE